MSSIETVDHPNGFNHISSNEGTSEYVENHPRLSSSSTATWMPVEKKDLENGESEHIPSALLAKVRRGITSPGLSSTNLNISLRDVAVEAAEFAQDQLGSRFLQQSLENATEDERYAVFCSILPHTTKLTTDAFGNYVIQVLPSPMHSDLNSPL